MSKLAFLMAFLAALVAGCGTSNTATQNTSPPEETTTSGTLAQSTQPTSTAQPSPDPQETTAVSRGESAAGWVSAIGDSVMLGAVDALEQKIPNLALLHAQGSRQPSTAIDLLQRWRTAGYLGDAVVVDIGNNGPFSPEQFDQMMRVLARVSKVLIVNLTVPPSVDDPVAVSNNAMLTDGVPRYSNAILVDWHTASTNHPAYFSGDDNIHLSLEGAQAYAQLIAAHLGDEKAAKGSEAAALGSKEKISWGEGGTAGECVGPSSWCSIPD